MVIYFDSSPVAEDDVFDISFNGQLALDVTANDFLPGNYNITFTNPSHGNVTLNSSGEMTFVSDLVYVGVDEFSYEICSDFCPDECSTATVTLIVGADAQCIVPTIFTPNNDGVNDEFIVPCLGTDDFEKNKVMIFNQWGDEVFRAAPYQNDWRGTFKGEDLPSGTYFTIIDFGKGDVPVSGFLVLER